MGTRLNRNSERFTINIYLRKNRLGISALEVQCGHTYSHNVLSQTGKRRGRKENLGRRVPTVTERRNG